MWIGNVAFLTIMIAVVVAWVTTEDGMQAVFSVVGLKGVDKLNNRTMKSRATCYY